MALTLETLTRNASCNAEVDLIDAAVAAGYVTITTSADAVLATLTCGDPAFGGAATGVATANAIASVTASGTGTAAKYKVYDGDSNLLWTGTVTASGGGGDMTISNTSITSGDDIEITSWTHTVPAS